MGATARSAATARPSVGDASVRRALFIVLLTCAAGCTEPIDVVNYRFTPLVVDETRTTPVLLETKILGAPDSVALALESTGSEVALVDDGTGSDATAGDDVYTIELPAADVLYGFGPADVYRNFVGYLRAYDQDSIVQEKNFFVDVITSAIPTPIVVQPSPTFQYSEHLVNIVDPAFYGTLDHVPLVQQFYTLVHDDFDFLAVVFDVSHLTERFYGGVSNDVNGIGVGVFNDSTLWGTHGRLAGRLVFPIATMFDGASPAFTHELGHRWINHLPVPPVDVGAPHWPLSDLAVGIMGFTSAFNPTFPQGLNFNFDLVPNGPDYDLVTNNSPKEFSDLSLYLMGFIPAAQVVQHFVFDDQLQTPATGGTLLGPVTTVDVADIVAARGARSPDHTASPTDFRVATLMVSRDGLLNLDAMRQYDFFAARAMEEVLVDYTDGFAVGQSNPFHLATQGIGHLDSRIMELLARADFEADALGGLPSTAPPPDPPSDMITVQGEAGAVEIVNSGPLGSQSHTGRARLTVSKSRKPMGG